MMGYQQGISGLLGSWQADYTGLMIYDNLYKTLRTAYNGSIIMELGGKG